MNGNFDGLTWVDPMLAQKDNLFFRLLLVGWNRYHETFGKQKQQND